MYKFALTKNEFARGSIDVYKLVVDDVDQFVAFEDSVEKINFSEFKSFAATISQISENKKQPPRGKRRKIKGLDNAGEMRTKNLRLYYLVIKEHGYTICIGGSKKSQKKEIKRLKQLQKDIFEQIKNMENSKLNNRPKLTREMLLQSSEFWVENIRTELFNMVQDYLEDNNMSRKELAEKLGVSKGYISQILNGDSDHRLSKIVSLATALGKAPYIYLKDLNEVLENEKDGRSVYIDFKEMETKASRCD